MNFIKSIKERTRQYCKENVAHLPVNKRFVSMKKRLAIKCFNDFPESYQERLREYLAGLPAKEVYLVGSLASGGGIIPGVTPQEFIELRAKHSHKTRKSKSDIDLYIIGNDGEVILHREDHEVVNIESLPMRFEPYCLIFENGQWI